MAVELSPIGDADVTVVADFLHANLNRRVPPSTWARAISAPWQVEAPNHGFMLRDGQRVVGAYLAFYCDRTVAGRVERFCNLASWCVLPDFRFHSVRLLKALLAQDGYHFTDLSPSGNVVPLNARLKFSSLDTVVLVVPNLPWPALPGRTRISADPAVIESMLTGTELALYRDHAQAPAARHLVLVRGGDCCYVMFRERWWRGHPVFAVILHVSNPELFRRAIGPLSRHLLIRHRFLATLVELRIVGSRPRRSVPLPLPAPRTLARPEDTRAPWSYAARYHGTIPHKMYRSVSLEPAQIDDLYSELVCVPGW